MPLKAIVPSADEIVLANLPFKQAKKGLYGQKNLQEIIILKHKL